MSNFSKRFTKEISFDGDEVVVEMRRMKRKDALKLSTFMSVGDGDDEVKMSFTDQFEMIDVAADMLPKYLISIKGLFIDDVEVSISDDDTMKIVYEEAYFISLLSEIISVLMQKSFLNEDGVEKKSVKSPESDTVDSETTPT